VSQAITGLEALKLRLRVTWMSGDFDEIAQIIEPGAVEFIEFLALGPSMCALDAACGSGNLSLSAARAGATPVPQAFPPQVPERAPKPSPPHRQR